MTTLLIPPVPATFSAWGLHCADYVEDAVRTSPQSFDETTCQSVIALLRELQGEARPAILSYGFADDTVTDQFRLEVRFRGQEYTLPVVLDPGWLDAPEALLRGVREHFVADHRRLYGHAAEDGPLEVVTMRCRCLGAVVPPSLASLAASHAQPQAIASRAVHFDHAAGAVDTAIYRREELGAGGVFAGPAIIEEWTTTTLLPPGWQARVHDSGTIIATHAVAEKEQTHA